MFKKKPKIIFTFEDKREGFMLHTKIKGKIKDEYIMGLKQFIDKAIKNKPKEKTVKVMSAEEWQRQKKVN